MVSSSKTKQLHIDLNCDIAQSFGVYKNDVETALLPYVSSVNVSCGSHSGDPITISKALKEAEEKNLALGAHVGFPDIQGFGYRDMQLSEEELKAVITYQIGALTALAKLYNLKVEYVRPHGALYKQAATNFNTSLIIAKAIAEYDPWLIYVGAVGSNLKKAGETAKIRIAQEVHLDKKYNHDGSIDFEAGNIADYSYSVELLEGLISDSVVKNNEGGKTRVEFDTIHLNMNSQASLNLARKAKELIPQPIPVAAVLIEDTGWLD